MPLERDVILPWVIAASVLLWLLWGRTARGRGRQLFTWTNAAIVSASAAYAALWITKHARLIEHAELSFWAMAILAALAPVAALRITGREVATAGGVPGWRERPRQRMQSGYRWLGGALLTAAASVVALDLAGVAVAIADKGTSWLPVAPINALIVLPHLVRLKGMTLSLLIGSLIASVYVTRASGRRAVALVCALGTTLGALEGPWLLLWIVPAPDGVTLWLNAAGAFVGLAAALALLATNGLAAPPAPPQPPAAAPLAANGKEPEAVRRAQVDLQIAAAVLVGCVALLAWRRVPAPLAAPAQLLWLACGAALPALVLLVRGRPRMSPLEIQFARVLAWIVAVLIGLAFVWPAPVPFSGAMMIFYLSPASGLILLALMILHIRAARSAGRASPYFSVYARSRGLGLGVSYATLFAAALTLAGLIVRTF